MPRDVARACPGCLGLGFCELSFRRQQSDGPRYLAGVAVKDTLELRFDPNLAAPMILFVMKRPRCVPQVLDDVNLPFLQA